MSQLCSKTTCACREPGPLPCTPKQWAMEARFCCARDVCIRTKAAAHSCKTLHELLPAAVKCLGEPRVWHLLSKPVRVFHRQSGPGWTLLRTLLGSLPTQTSGSDCVLLLKEVLRSDACLYSGFAPGKELPPLRFLQWQWAIKERRCLRQEWARACNLVYV